jgi:hypothetical protein
MLSSEALESMAPRRVRGTDSAALPQLVGLPKQQRMQRYFIYFMEPTWEE